ncbi:MAG TPA: hypothetical protein DCZ94_03750 [Lentisphaeria bacterium]|nr:hypothetical protein [Lentisphaeria bacterium]
MQAEAKIQPCFRHRGDETDQEKTCLCKNEALFDFSGIYIICNRLNQLDFQLINFGEIYL